MFFKGEAARMLVADARADAKHDGGSTSFTLEQRLRLKQQQAPAVEGVLLKRDKRQHWKPRYFALVGNQLRYYSKNGAARLPRQLKGVADLNGLRVVEEGIASGDDNGEKEGKGKAKTKGKSRGWCELRLRFALAEGHSCTCALRMPASRGAVTEAAPQESGLARWAAALRRCVRHNSVRDDTGDDFLARVEEALSAEGVACGGGGGSSLVRAAVVLPLSGDSLGIALEQVGQLAVVGAAADFAEGSAALQMLERGEFCVGDVLLNVRGIDCVRGVRCGAHRFEDTVALCGCGGASVVFGRSASFSLAQARLDNAAVRAQAAARGWFGRRGFARQRSAAVRVQQRARGWVHRRKCARAAGSANMLQARWRARVLQRAQTVLLQALARGALARRSLKEAHAAAARLQKVARGALARRRAAENSLAAALLQARWRGCSGRRRVLLLYAFACRRHVLRVIPRQLERTR